MSNPGFTKTTVSRTAEGDSLKLDLYLPSPRPPGALPCALLLHGFGGNRSHLSGHAAKLAADGTAVLCPDMSPLMRFPLERSQLRNVSQIIDHVAWLFGPARPAGDLDASRFWMAGHSAGFAVLFEAALTVDPAPCVLVALDGVPWPRTIARAPDFDPRKTQLVSLRCEPGSWNRNGEMHREMVGKTVAPACGKLSTPDGPRYTVLDVLFPGSQHGDPMAAPDPPGFAMRAMGLVGLPGRKEGFAAVIEAVGTDVAAGEGGPGRGLPRTRAALGGLQWAVVRDLP